MARNHCTVGVAGVTTGTSAKTILQLIAATNVRVALKRLSISFRGTSNTDTPVLVELLRQTTAGTMTAATPVSRQGIGTETIQTTAAHTASAEPTAGNVLYRLSVHPQTGAVIDFVGENEILIPGGGRLGVRVTAAQSQTADVQADFEE